MRQSGLLQDDNRDVSEASTGNPPSGERLIALCDHYKRVSVSDVLMGSRKIYIPAVVPH